MAGSADAIAPATPDTADTAGTPASADREVVTSEVPAAAENANGHGASTATPKAPSSDT